MGMLLQEIILTRIFSVTMFYHFAFMVVSITLFGIGVSGIWVYLNPKRFARENAPKQMARSALLFALAVPLCFILQRNLPAAADSPRWGLLYLAATYVLIAIPFFLGARPSPWRSPTGRAACRRSISPTWWAPPSAAHWSSPASPS
jgi:hypothetical protein